MSAPTGPVVRPPQSRAGNGMARGRRAAVAGARRVLAERGVRRTTMSEVAVRGGLAKATLYNHVRTKDQLLDLVVADGLARVVAAAADALGQGDLAAALARASGQLAEDEVLVGLRQVEPAALVALAAPGDGPGWEAARGAVAGALERVGRISEPATVDVVLRWLLSFVLAPGSPAVRTASAAVVADAVPARAARTTFVTPAGAQPDPGGGWNTDDVSRR